MSLLVYKILFSDFRSSFLQPVTYKLTQFKLRAAVLEERLGLFIFYSSSASYIRFRSIYPKVEALFFDRIVLAFHFQSISWTTTRTTASLMSSRTTRCPPFLSLLPKATWRFRDSVDPAASVCETGPKRFYDASSLSSRGDASRKIAKA